MDDLESRRKSGAAACQCPPIDGAGGWMHEVDLPRKVPVEKQNCGDRPGWPGGCVIVGGRDGGGQLEPSGAAAALDFQSSWASAEVCRGDGRRGVE